MNQSPLFDLKPVTIAPAPLSKRLGMKKRSSVSEAPESDENYTPRRYWQPALDMFDRSSFELDAATYEGAEVPADRIFTLQNSALTQEWRSSGPVWLNHPYSLNNEFTDKLIEQWQKGSFRELFMLPKTDNSTGWYQKLIKHSTAICLIGNRIAFNSRKRIEAGTKPIGGYFPSSIVYFGHNLPLFHHHYSPLGEIVVRYKP